MITDHRWRPTIVTNTAAAEVPWANRPCAYANCDKPRAEHATSVSPSWGRRQERRKSQS